MNDRCNAYYQGKHGKHKSKWKIGWRCCHWDRERFSNKMTFKQHREQVASVWQCVWRRDIQREERLATEELHSWIKKASSSSGLSHHPSTPSPVCPEQPFHYLCRSLLKMCYITLSPSEVWDIIKSLIIWVDLYTYTFSMQAMHQLSFSCFHSPEGWEGYKIGVDKSVPLWTDSLMRVLCDIVKTA